TDRCRGPRSTLQPQGSADALPPLFVLHGRAARLPGRARGREHAPGQAELGARVIDRLARVDRPRQRPLPLANAGTESLMASGLREADGPAAPRSPPARDAATSCHVIQHGGSGPVDFSRETVEGLLADGGFFWLDLD